MKPEAYLSILHTAERLKDTPRHCTTSGRRTESVAEHCWRVSLMALLLRHEFPELDIDRAAAMSIVHDLGECFTGDIPVFEKTDADRRTENALLSEWAAALPPEISADITALLAELEAQQTPEAKLCKALDKLEALIQHNESPLDTWTAHERELNKTYAFDTVGFSEWLTELRRVILKETLEKIERERLP